MYKQKATQWGSFLAIFLIYFLKLVPVTATTSKHVLLISRQFKIDLTPNKFLQN